MYKTINEDEFIREFRGSEYSDAFSNEGLRGMFRFYKKLENIYGIRLTLDVSNIACSFTEFDSLDDINIEMGKGYSSIEDLENDTTVVYHSDNSIVIQNF